MLKTLLLLIKINLHPIGISLKRSELTQKEVIIQLNLAGIVII